MSQPALSYQIASLEREVGFSLFVRSGRRVRLTPAGKRLYESLLQIRTLLNRALEECRDESDEARGELLVSWSAVICDRRVIADISSAFQREHPDVSVTIAEADPMDMLGMKGGRQVDVLVTLGEDLGHEANWFSFPLFAEVVACVLSASHPLAASHSLTLDMLRSQTMLLVPADSYRASYKRLADQILASLPAGCVKFMGSSSEAEVNVAAGKDISVKLVRPGSAEPPVPGCVAIPLEPEVTTHVVAAYAGDDPQGVKRLFCKFAQTYCEERLSEGVGR